VPCCAQLSRDHNRARTGSNHHEIDRRVYNRAAAHVPLLSSQPRRCSRRTKIGDGGGGLSEGEGALPLASGYVLRLATGVSRSSQVRHASYAVAVHAMTDRPRNHPLAG
jgi:hypothetical protein